MDARIDYQAGTEPRNELEGRLASAQSATTPAGTPKTRRANMHDGIAVWCDCCSCEAEPRWVAVAEELGIDLGDDYEDAGAQSR
jgi:hypothetical protein